METPKVTDSNNFAITTKGIGDALQVSASAMAAAGNTLDETIALTTAANTIVQNPNTVGTALKTLSLRIRGVKTELEEAGLETEGMAETTSQLQAKLLALTDGKVNIMVDANNFKNTTEILREISAEWENLTDVERAATLELLGGKRQANILASIINNFDIVEDAIEASANSAGSAMEENEKVLDSIQGRINLFNNALQTMWSNSLDSDLIKGIVNFGTEIIRAIDKLGLLKSVLLTFGTFKGLKYLSEGLGISSIVGDTLKATNALELLDAETRKVALAMITEGLQTRLAGSALVEYAVKMKLAEAADISKMTTTQLLGLSFKALGVAIWNATKAVAAFLFTNPVGQMLLVVGLVVAGIAAWNKWGDTTENLQEKLDELKSELRDIQSELDSLNTELETTRDRMTELLSMESLSFTEKEELENLQKQNDELEREIYLLEQRQKRKQKDAENAFDDLMYGEFKYGTSQMGISTSLTERDLLESSMKQYQEQLEAEEEARKSLVAAEKSLEQAKQKNDKKAIKKAEKDVEKAEKNVEKAEDVAGVAFKHIDEKLKEYTDAADGIDYDLADDETKEYLDYIYNLEDRFNILTGDDKAKTIAIKAIFNKKEFSNVSKTIDSYVEALKKGDKSAEESIGNIIVNNEALVENIWAKGLSVDEAVDYFTSFASDTNYATVERKVKEMEEATSRLPKLLENAFSKDFVGPLTEQQRQFAALFDEDGNVLSEKIAEYFGGEGGGISEKTRVEIERLVKQIYDGKISVENALKQFELFGIESALDIHIVDVQTNFKDVFPDLAKDADGLIDTFKELGDAIGSAAGALDTLNQAQKEMSHSGHVSIETALQLMEYTDDYGSVLEVVDGKLKLVDGAEEALINSRIESIRVSARASLADAQATYEKAQLALDTYEAALVSDKSAETVAKAQDKLLAKAHAFAAGIKAIFSGGSWTEAYNSTYQKTLSNITGYETEYTDEGLQSLMDNLKEAEKIRDEAQDRVNLADQLTPDTLKSTYDSGIADGSDKTNAEKEAEDAFKKAMEYWENRIGAEQSRFEQVQNEIDLLEKQGKVAGKDYYEEQIDSENRRLSLLQQQKVEATKYLGTFKEGSDEWWDAANQLNDIENEIDGVTTSILDLRNAMAEVDWYIFDEAHERFDNLHSDLDTIRNLVAPNGEEDWFDDEGQWTDKGTAYLASYITDLQFYESELASVNKKLKEHSLQYTGNEEYYKKLGIDSEQELYDKREELLDQQYKIRGAQNDTQQSVADMYESQIDVVEEYTNKLVDSYNDYIDVVKEALDAERELFELKKDIQKQTKDIVSLERRIASLSGSDSASDIAERRKLEAELYEAREGLDDTYYSHAKDAQSEALDREAEAYEKSMNKFIEGLRKSLDTALLDMEGFMGLVANAVTTNAPAIVEQYNGLGIALNSAIIDPWTEAANKITAFGGVDGLGIMNSWVTEGGAIYKFDTDATKLLKSPWGAGTTALNSFKGSVTTKMGEIYKDINSNVSKSITDIKKLATEIAKINDSTVRPKGVDTDTKDIVGPPKKPSSEPLKKPTMSKQGTTAPNDKVYLQGDTIQAADGKTYYKLQGRSNAYVADGSFTKTGKNKGWVYEGTYWYRPKYAKGTTGTSRDELAVVDELGPELILHADPTSGRLQYLTKGSGVVPHDATVELMKLADLGLSGLMDANKFGANVNMISNAINKPELNITFDSLVKAENITEETIPAVRKLVTQELNRFTKELNYALKGKGAR